MMIIIWHKINRLLLLIVNQTIHLYNFVVVITTVEVRVLTVFG